MTHSSDRKNAEEWPLEIGRRIADQGTRAVRTGTIGESPSRHQLV